jgi:hypothetical protein
LALASSLHPIKVWRMKAISRQGMQGWCLLSQTATTGGSGSSGRSIYRK